ncbi:MAG: hypothetical protein DMF64_06075 [Acidobacteria bacterium]|nr:MAG: hypothetical protein DMF64_06075 [Acidobacteriota bacterium]
MKFSAFPELPALTLIFALAVASCGESLNERLLKAAADGNTAEVKTLLNNGAYVNYRQGCRTPLLNAVIGNHSDTVAALMKAGANDNERDCDGKSPLLIAAQHNYSDVRDMILRHGEPVWTPTPTVYATLKPASAQIELNKQLFSLIDNIVATDGGEKEDPANVEAAKKLVLQGADVNARDIGQTPLIRAAQNGHIKVMRALLEHGADVNAQDDRGETALMIAAGETDPDMVRLLLSKGAVVNLKDKSGSPLGLALK